MNNESEYESASLVPLQELDSVVAMDDKTGRQESLFNLLEKSGFSKEAVLKDEMDGEDVIFFTYIEKFMGRKAV